MPNRIQPGDQIGPNNAGKMILRGCFMNVSEDWLRHTSGDVGELLTHYLHNRQNEATAITLNYRDSVPEGREGGPHRLDLEFMEEATEGLARLELSGNNLGRAKEEDIFDQITDQVTFLNGAIKIYVDKCEKEGIEPMFTGIPSIIIKNVLARDPVTHAQSLLWEVRAEPTVAVAPPTPEFDLFEGMQIHDHGPGPK